MRGDAIYSARREVSMSRWTRRKFLKTSLAASASAVAAKAALPLTGAGAAEGAATKHPELGAPALQNAATNASPRERLMMDFGWRFHFGHADDPAKDFGFGALNREATFAKTGAFPPVTR